jgi:hypothetical protein
MTYDRALAYYAAVFAADAGTDALYHNRYTEDMARMCISVAEEAIKRGEAACRAKKRFHTLVFIEGAANALNRCHAATLEQLLDAGQMESDSLAGEAN